MNPWPQRHIDGFEVMCEAVSYTHLDCIAEALRDVSTREGQYPLAFEFETSHANPCYHEFVATVCGLSDEVARRFDDRMRSLGLPPPRSVD